MTVKELKELLSMYDDSCKVKFSHSYNSIIEHDIMFYKYCKDFEQNQKLIFSEFNNNIKTNG